MERWESRWLSSKTRYQSLSTVTLVLCWSTPGMRFCTSEQKTHPIVAELKRRFKGQRIVNVTGVRREESRNRARMPIFDIDRTGQILNWRSIIDYSVDDVFKLIDASRLSPHPAYPKFGMSRVSCRFCIMSNLSDLTAASAQVESHDLYRRMVQLEIDSSFAFQGARWLGDVAPHLLSVDMRDALDLAKYRAVLRKEIESQITKSMLYVSGWPTRMLSDGEAELLASVRTKISQLYHLDSQYLTVADIHSRYAELMAERARKQAA